MFSVYIATRAITVHILQFWSSIKSQSILEVGPLFLQLQSVIEDVGLSNNFSVIEWDREKVRVLFIVCFPDPGKLIHRFFVTSSKFLESEYVVFRFSWSSDFLKYLSEVYWGKTPYFSFLYIWILLIINVELYLAVSVIFSIVYSWRDFRVFRRIHKRSCRLDGIAVTLIRLNSLGPRF